MPWTYDGAEETLKYIAIACSSACTATGSPGPTFSWACATPQLVRVSADEIEAKKDVAGDNFIAVVGDPKEILKKIDRMVMDKLRKKMSRDETETLQVTVALNMCLETTLSNRQ
ncbi:hypothetical protein DIPPA_25787 [Diplonema papillatum]|nr:hypothetical protein DIPPA_25787 [Diplonema papillatum]